MQCPPPGDSPNPGIKPRSPVLQVDSLPFEPPGKPTPSGDLPNPGIELGSPALWAYSLPAELPGKPEVHCATKSLQPCPTLCDPMDCSLPGFSVHGILQARTLEWVAVSFSKVHCRRTSMVASVSLTWKKIFFFFPSSFSSLFKA